MDARWIPIEISAMYVGLSLYNYKGIEIQWLAIPSWDPFCMLGESMLGRLRRENGLVASMLHGV